MGNEDKYAQYPERPSDSRVRYFDGQFLGSQDFIDEQRYHVDRMRRHTAQLRVRGVSDGLGVSATGVLKVKIEAGTAIDDRGRQIVLLAARELTLPGDLAKPAQYVLCLVFAQPTDRTMGGNAEQKGTRGDTRFRDDATVSAYAVGKAAPEGAVGLALLTIDAGGGVVVSAPADVRVYSGLRLGGPAGPTLVSGGDPRPKDALLAGNLRVLGSLSVQDGVIFNGPTPVEGTKDLGLYSQVQGGSMRLVTRGGPVVLFNDGGIGSAKAQEFHANGDVTLNWLQNPLRISGTWNGFGDGSKNAEISNDSNQYKCLMVVGNGTGGAGRVVGVWDHLNVAGRARVVTGLSIGNPGATRMLQIGGIENGIGMDASDASPNAGYVRFGDNTGWRLHFARAKDSPAGPLNQGPGASVMTIHDSGHVSIGTVAWSEQVRLRLHGATIANQWCGRLVAGGENSVIVAGEFSNQAVLGAHNPALNAWADLVVNPGGKVAIATTSPENASLTVQGTTVLRTGGANSWDRLVVTTTKDWGDGENQYVTLGAGGASGIMLSNPHVSWRDGRASIRYGRTGGEASNTYWDAGVRGDGSFSWTPLDNNPANGQELLKVDRNGWVTLGGRAPLRFTHGWTGFPDGNAQASEISNDIDTYKCLMVIGNKSAGGERRVGIWDRLDVNGTLNVNGGQVANGTLTVNQAGNWAGLRVTNHTNRGVYMNLCYEGDNNTFVMYHQNGQGQYMRQDGVWNRNSDRSLKHDVTAMDDALELASRLRPVRFKWNATGTPCLGFIAQEVLPLFPEIVSESVHGEGDAARKVLGLKYDTFGVIAVAAVQQLKQQLEAKIAALDAQLRELAGVRAR
ncbi:MAG: tail fiber domain-containing protein [Nannocystis sp.]|uniref:tail fiber domain-containing protein n=1 Tax=Nannocystis sp. TaxID=1962667 RepID=UPI0024282571|nr:tail fiber domain-containing protein [Nannocystis sp.]MBK9755577.1 tail fiber domain-containing protein [Nannocystis sp.]